MKIRCLPLVLAAFAPLVAASVSGCKEAPPKLTGPAAGASASGSVTPITALSVVTPPIDEDKDKFPLDDKQIQAIVNPGGATDYTGPTGAVEGTIRVKGDPPATKTFMQLPPSCASAVPIHAPAYRAGDEGELADVLVGVIGYSGYVRPSREDKIVTIKNCAIEPTVIDLSLGQRLLVANADPMPYTPQIATKLLVQRVAIQGMSAVPLNITQPGAYGLTWLTGALPGSNVPSATVFVLPSALHMVTGPDGKFRIGNVPVGKVRVTASHLGMPEAAKDVEIKAGEVAKLDLVMEYKAPAAAPTTKPKPHSSIH